MTEREAVEKLCAVLNELKAAGYAPSADRDGHGIWVGDVVLVETYTLASGWGDWEVES